MNWKIAIGALGGGVGALALAPFTGGGSLLAAATLAESLAIAAGAEAIAVATTTAVVGVGLGAGAGYASSKNDEKKVKNAKEKGYKKGKAENAIEIAKLKKNLQESYTRMASADKYFKTLIAMENVAVAVIADNGLDTQSRQNEIADLLRSVSNDTLPKNIQNEINHIYSNPPTIKEALILAKNANLERYICRDVIMLTAESFDINKEKYLNLWQQYS